MAVIQNEKGLKNAREIIKETDIVVLKRSFLATAMSVEKVNYLSIHTKKKQLQQDIANLFVLFLNFKQHLLF